MTVRNKIDFVILILERITLCGINRAIFSDDTEILHTYVKMISNVVRTALTWGRKSVVKNLRLNFNILREDTPIGLLKICFMENTLLCIISVR